MSKKTMHSCSASLLDGMSHTLAYRLVQISYHILCQRRYVDIDTIQDVFSALSALMRELYRRNGLLSSKSSEEAN